MNLIELHILQSFPVSCLNRDDVGSPKTAIFGGHQRARISSQCLKRAARLTAADIAPAGFQGIRSRFLKDAFANALGEAGLDPTQIEEKATAICNALSTVDKKDPKQVTTAVFLSPSEIQQIATAVAAGEDPRKAPKKVTRLDAADIALFGRMVANDATLNVEGAAMFSHALSTHKASNDIDFYSAVDDRKGDSEDAGAGMIGTLEFTSATYYRYAAVNLDLLFDDAHLAKLGATQRQAVLDAFIRATLTAVPNARKNSMNAATLPSTVLGVRKTRGQPLQLINAFESPVTANGSGLAATSAECMKAHHETLKATWGVETRTEVWLPETTLADFITQLTAND